MRIKIIWFKAWMLIIGIFSLQLAYSQCTADWIFEDEGLTISFINQSTTQPGDPIVSYSWDFGDGSSSTEANPTHTYTSPDEYFVCLTITTQNGCSDQLCSFIEHCTLTINATIGEDCDQNNEVTINVTINDIYDRARDVNVFLDGVIVPGSPFEIDDDAPVVLMLSVPGDGLLHTIFVQSIDVDHCNATLEFTTIDCSSGCFLNSMAVEFTGGTVQNVDVGGNFFAPENTTITIGDVVRFTWIDGGHSSTSDATTGPDSWNTGVIDLGSVFDLTLTNPGVHQYYCIPHGGPGGVGMSGQIIANCPPSGMFDLLIEFNTSVANAAGYNLLIDDIVQPGSPFTYSGIGTNSLTVQIAGDGLDHSITIQDVADPTCTSTRMILAPDCGAAPTCSVSVSAMETGGCDASMQVPVELTISSINGGASGFNVIVDGNQVAGPILYDASGTTLVNVNITGDGQPHNITVQDIDDAACSGITIITTQNCSIPCQLTNLTLSTGSTFTHIVEVQDFEFIPQNITIASGDLVQFTWTGQVAHTSTSDATSGPDSWDSGLLNNGATFTTPVLSEGVHPYYCIPHGAPGGIGMSGSISVQANCTNGQVSVQCNFAANGEGFDGYQILVDGNPVPGGPFTYDPGGVNSNSILVNGDGQLHTIQIQDVADPSCSVSGSITTPDCNASTCQLTASALETGGCNNNQVPVEVTVNDIGGGPSGFTIDVDGISQGTFQYDISGTTVVTLNVTGDGQSHSIVLSDIDDPTCTTSTSIITTDCTLPCVLSGLSLSTGTSTTHSVAVMDFEFLPANINITSGDVVEFVWTGQVAHTSTSDATSGPDSWDSGLLNNGAIFTSPVLSEGVHPYYCIPHGAPGGIGMAGTITVQADCNNGQVSVQISFSVSGGGLGGFEILVDGVVTGGAMSYDPSGINQVTVLVAGDGQPHTIEVRDVENQTCSISGSITTPDCNASTCQLNASAVESGGCNNNQVPVEVTVNDIGGGPSGFTIDVDGISQGSFQYDISGTTVVSLNATGDGQSHSIVLSDIDDPTCTTSTSIITTDCTLPCVLSGLSLSTGTSTTHSVAVMDFEFLPANINITSGDVVEFVWTGQVAHTSTSDATSGPDSWDSGLLDNGAIFTTPVLSEGVHPYYCIPHGAPGGIGMAGTITVQADCNNGQVSVQISFSVSGGGLGGFEILVDGVVTGGAMSYDPSGINQVTVLVAGDGQPHTIEVRDVENQTCSISGSITTPDCNASTCQLTTTASIVSGCDMNGEVQVQVEVSDIGGGDQGFNLLVDGNVWQGSPFTYDLSGTTSIMINLAGDGLVHTITTQDVVDMSCISGTSIQLADCSQDCQLFGADIDFGATVLHQVEVRDFEFFPSAITVGIGDTVRFVWTGVVAHTTTSDIDFGPNAWDSGLLNNGAIFDVIITDAGIHPYYCIPHGAPGGIGMAGTITALADCENDQVQASLTFQTSGSAGTGYQILVDGNILDGSPFGYLDGMNQMNNIMLPGDGQEHTVVAQDVDDMNCNTSVTVVTPDCNASTCQLDLTAIISGPCNAVYQVPVEIQIISSGAGTNGFNLFVDGIIDPGSPYSYANNDTTGLSIVLPGDGQSHSIFVFDQDDVSCTATTTLQLPNCSQVCDISNIQVAIAQSSVHIVEVRDFEFSPQDIEVSTGDTIRFIWTGVVAHTTTSDTNSGFDSWDSGLLGQNASYDIVIHSAGYHPYYCIPHGAPGGIGMAGSITAIEPCVDQLVSGEVCFEHSAQSLTGYHIVIDGIALPDGPFLYENDGTTCKSVLLPADGMVHTILIQDAESSDCSADTSLLIQDCEDPCFGFSADFQYTIDQLGLIVEFVNQSSMVADSLVWHFGDGLNGQDENPVHQYDSSGNYTICLEAYSQEGCADTTCYTVFVGAFVCEAAFLFESSGLTVNFLNTSLTTDSISSINWSLGDGNSITALESFSYTYDTLGVYTVCMTIEADTCIQTICQNIDLSSPCNILISDFDMTIEGATIQFQDMSSGNVQSWLWGFGDGNTSTDQNTTHTYNAAGEYTVCLLVFDLENNCSDFKCIDISIVLTSISQPDVRSLIIFPNPASSSQNTVSIVGLESSELDDEIEIQIVDFAGRSIRKMNWTKSELNRINLQIESSLVPGPYLIRVISNEHIYLGKLIIQE